MTTRQSISGLPSQLALPPNVGFSGLPIPMVGIPTFLPKPSVIAPRDMASGAALELALQSVAEAKRQFSDNEPLVGLETSDMTVRARILLGASAPMIPPMTTLAATVAPKLPIPPGIVTTVPQPSIKKMSPEKQWPQVRAEAISSLQAEEEAKNLGKKIALQ